MKICEAIPFKSFKEKINLVKNAEKNNRVLNIEIYKNFVIIQYKF
ncbi:hypothetical protein ACV3RS_09710 [Clostridium perfringens]